MNLRSTDNIADSNNNMIYIMSPSFSGSTLLTILMAAHPHISTIGELKATQRYAANSNVCSCGKKIEECQFWSRVKEEMSNRGRQFSLDDFGTHFGAGDSLGDRLLRAGVRGVAFEAARDIILRAIPSFRAKLKSIVEQNRIIIRIINDIQGKQYFLDGSKDPNRLKLMLHAGLWNVKAIVLNRDGRGFTNSCVRRGNNPGEAIDAWLRTQREMSMLMEILGAERYINVRYEDVVKSPQKELDRIYEFIGLERMEIQEYSSTNLHILGNTMRLKFTGEITLDDKWKTELDRYPLELFEARAGSVNRRLGYE